MSARLSGHRWYLTCFELRSPYMYNIARRACPTTLMVKARSTSFDAPPIVFATTGSRRSAWVSADVVTFRIGSVGKFVCEGSA